MAVLGFLICEVGPSTSSLSRWMREMSLSPVQPASEEEWVSDAWGEGLGRNDRDPARERTAGRGQCEKSIGEA